jgi:LPXTG-site transpeptidase (sortase) family protein
MLSLGLPSIHDLSLSECVRDSAEIMILTRQYQAKRRAIEQLLLWAGVVLLGFSGAVPAHSLLVSQLSIMDVPAVMDGQEHTHPRLSQHHFVSVLATRTLARRPLAVLSIPRLHLLAPILEGTDTFTLHDGVGRIRGTAQIGQRGNIGIAGYRDSFFRHLKDVAIGDQVEIIAGEQTFIYAADRIETVGPEDMRVLQPRQNSGITLVTCYPFYYVGRSPRRYVVEASLQNLARNTYPESK